MLSALVSLLVFALIVCVVAYVANLLIGMFITDRRFQQIIWVIAGLFVLIRALELFGLLNGTGITHLR